MPASQAEPRAGALGGYADWPAFLSGAPVRSRKDADRRALAEVLGVRFAGAWHDVGHEFAAAMQDEARAFLGDALASRNRFPRAAR